MNLSSSFSGIIGSPPGSPLFFNHNFDVSSVKKIDIEELGNMMQHIFILSSSQNEDSIIKKKEYEAYLLSFKKQPYAWILVEYYLNNVDLNSSPINQYILWFGLSILDEWLPFQWHLIPLSHQQYLRRFLFQYLLQNYQKLPSFLCNKICKLLAQIGKIEWPHNYPNFLTDLQAVAGQPNTTGLGVYLLTVVAEEFFSTNRGDISSSRKRELETLLSSQVGEIVNTMERLLRTLFESFVQKGRFDPKELELCKILFEGLNAWVQIPNLKLSIPISLWGLIFDFVNLKVDCSVWAITLALELISKKQVPYQSSSLVLAIFQHTFTLLQSLTSNVVEELNDDLLAKLTEFLAEFFSNYLLRLESNKNVPFVDFLSNLFFFTFLKANSSEQYLRCLEIWSTFLDFLFAKKEKSEDTYKKYESGLISLNKGVIQKIQFLVNGNELSQLDDETKNEDNLTEKELFIKENLEVLAKIADLFPNCVFEELGQLLNKNFLFQLFSFLKVIVENPGFSFSNEQKDKFFSVILDCRTCFQLFGRLVEQFINNFASTFNFCWAIILKFLELLRILTTHKLWNSNVQFTKLLNECLFTLLTFVRWISFFEAKIQENMESLSNINPQELSVAISHIFDIILITLDESVINYFFFLFLIQFFFRFQNPLRKLVLYY